LIQPNLGGDVTTITGACQFQQKFNHLTPSMVQALPTIQETSL
jgi:hypothetical protein